MSAQHEKAFETKISTLFDQLSQPARIQILVIIRKQPACVCHLVAALGLRQAAISQHLMGLREARWVSTRKQGRYVYYRLRDSRLVNLIEQAAAIAGIEPGELEQISRRPLENCPCPQCHPELSSEYSCSSLPGTK
ncbi:MAG TPA: metalloregulator ArsR/SmtB family transcription factor [Anaerolineaceae bacterium]|nr:metalloregulator ArsR/SmtB family transcription factor [Anaerolineaceae bacterium]